MHILEPKHTKLNSEEIEKVLSQYNIVVSQLPKISSKDPGIKEEVKPGDVIKIDRKEETYFRVVI
ncbi:MAG: DNA-directed RNA polymerase subunit H (RpoH/RPB5) [Patescibacteria group bacterium]|jgi:DNA-directed RNA polymerase subunit H (RpoH/RPB5)